MTGSRLRLGVLGGTFDPIHRVHLLMGKEAARALGLHGVLFVPTGQPSHRDPTPVSPAAHRCAMVSLAVARDARFALSTVDVARHQPTYTVDTLRELRDEYGAATELYFIVGADNLAQVPAWHRGAELLATARFVGWPRRGYPLADPGFPPGRLTMLSGPRPSASSTRIRQLVREGRSVSHLTPPSVARYIRAHRLYAGDAGSAAHTASACSGSPASVSNRA